MTRRTDHSPAEIAAMLAGRAEAVARHLLPNGTRRGHEWTVGGIDGAKTKADRVKVRLTDPLYPPMPPVGQPQPDAMTRQLIVNWVDSGAQQCDGGM